MAKEKTFLGSKKAQDLLEKVQEGFSEYKGMRSSELIKKWRKEATTLTGA